jgi:hypothetical protein
MATNPLTSDPRELQVLRMANKYKDPMRTRVIFYLTKLKNRKENNEQLSPADLSMAVGRAELDCRADEGVVFDREKVLQNTAEAVQGKGTLNLREVVDALPSGNLRGCA